MNPRGNAPLGVFDSGLGGLTVVRALRALLPNEDIVYLGDTARVPYGTRAPETVIRYALACARHLASRNVKGIIVACNTVSAVALDALRVELDLPVLGVIDPGARVAVDKTTRGHIAVLATLGTTLSGAYPRAVSQLCTRVEVTGAPAPLLVPLAEEGWTHGDVPRLVVRKYLEPLQGKGIDVIVLGCTHYPLLFDVIRSEAKDLLGEHVEIINSAEAVAHAVAAFLRERGLERQGVMGVTELLVTDMPKSFQVVASRFLGSESDNVSVIDL